MAVVRQIRFELIGGDGDSIHHGMLETAPVATPEPAELVCQCSSPRCHGSILMTEGLWFVFRSVRCRVHDLCGTAARDRPGIGRRDPCVS